METVHELVQQLRPELKLKRFGRVVIDTTEFMDIGPGDVIAVGGRHFLVYRDAVEQGFAYEDTKYWVKKCVELETGEPKLLKLVFHESFNLEYGEVVIKCFRSPRKEGRMLDAVRGDFRYMQGRTALDCNGNPVRIIDIITGKRIDYVTARIKADHQTYFRDHFPDLYRKFIGACEAISDLHAQGEQHGDINLDHLMKEYETGALRWIDFDYAYEASANPFALDLFGLGRILACIAGKWLFTPHILRDLGISIPPNLHAKDYSAVYRHEIMNLRKIFPHVPEDLNRILLHFSEGAEIGYDSVAEFVEEMKAVKL